MPKISGLPTLSSPADDDELAVVDDSAATTKKMTLGQLINYIRADRTRHVQMAIIADGSGGALAANGDLRPGVAFSGTPTTFARGVGRIPADYVTGTDVTIKLVFHSANTNTNETLKRYVYCQAVGATYDDWNVINNSDVTVSFVANIVTEISITIPAANCAAGNIVGFATGLTTALSGTVNLWSATIEYTADN